MTACQRCRAPLARGAPYCASCGYAAPPPPAGGFAPPVLARPPTAGGNTGWKVLTGCGLAGCLGAFLALAGGIALVVVLLMLGGSATGGSSASGGAVPTGGSLRDLVRPEVGPYRLVGTFPLDSAAPGVIDGVRTAYSAPDGTTINFTILLYASEPQASDFVTGLLVPWVGRLRPGEGVRSGNVVDSAGGVRGHTLCVTGATPEWFYWNNGRIVAIVEAPSPHARVFARGASGLRFTEGS